MSCLQTRKLELMVGNLPEITSPMIGGTGLSTHHPQCRCTVFVLSLLSWSLSPLLLASFFAWFRALALPLTLYAFSDTDVLRYERESNCPWRMKLREDVGVSSACCACCFLLHVGSLSPLSLLSSFCLGKWKKKVNKMHLYRYCDSELALIRNKNFLSTRYVVSNIDLYTHWQWKVFLGAESLY